MAASNRSHLARLTTLSASVALLATTACLPQGAVELDGETEFSTERLRPSLEPYNGTQPGIPEFYSDGNFYSGGMLSEEGSQRLSELTIADVPGELLSELHRSQCFWAFEGDTPAISYELLFKDAKYKGEVIDEVSICNGVGANIPDTREPFDGGETVDGVGVIGFDVSLVAFRGSAPDANRPCEIPIDVDGDGRTDAGDPAYDPFSRSFARFSMSNATALNGGELSALPVCAIRAAVPPVTRDTTFLLETDVANVGEVLIVTPEGQEIRRAGGGTMTNRPKLLEPRIQVVERPTSGADVFSIARPMTYDSELPEVEGDETTVRQLWRWAVPIGDDGVWHENFSALLSVNRVRVFRYGENEGANGNFDRVYLDPSRVRAFQGDDLAPDFRLLNCETVADEEGQPRECREALEFTPTYAHADRPQWITWVAQFRRVTRERPCLPSEGPGICTDVLEDTTVDPAEAVFVEFDLVGQEFGSQGSSLTVSPVTGGAFGNVVISESPSLEDALTIANLGRASVIVEDVWVDGPDASVFAARIEGGLVPPFVLPGQTALSVSLDARAESWGEKRAWLNFRARDGFGLVSHLDLPLTANAIDYVPDILPTSFWMTRDSQGFAPESSYVKSLFVSNYGVLALPRGAIEIRGPNAEAFSVVAVERSFYDPYAAPYDPAVNGEPAVAAREIAPRETEWLLVVYHPQDTWRGAGSAPDVAEIQMTIAGEVHVTPVQATCDGACWFAPPRPEVGTGGGTTGGGGPGVGIGR